MTAMTMATTRASRREPRWGRRPALLIATLTAALVASLVLVPEAKALSGDVVVADPSVFKVGSCCWGYSGGFEGGPGHGSVTIRKSCNSGG